MAKQNNTSSAQTGSFDNGLAEDVDGFHKQPNQWTQARNAVNNTTMGDIGELSNEASNYLCTAVTSDGGTPLTIIGTIHLGADEWAIFSTDNTESEIGIFKEDSCLYTKVVNDQCLNFKKKDLIKGVGRTTYDCGKQVYWDDGVNPTRVLNLDDVPWVQEEEVRDGCVFYTDTDVLDCEKIRLAPILKDLSFSVERGLASGDIDNGSYFVVGAYLVNGVKVTDYSLPSNVQSIFNHIPKSGSLDVFIDEADENFEEFELYLGQFVNFQTVLTRMGVYSTRQKKITFDTIDARLPKIENIGEIILSNPVIDKTDAVFRNGQYLIRTGPTEKFDFNYQPLANGIGVRWVSVEYPANYYRDAGNKVGYLRDEVYPFFIRWVYNTGDKSKSYHIPGRPSRAADTAPANVPEDLLDGDDTTGTGARVWNVYNTATVDPSSLTGNQPLPDGGVILGKGEMAYWESSEIYDDDKPQIWNASYHPWSQMNANTQPYASTNTGNYDLCGKPIRHHKFPENTIDQGPQMITNHYDPDAGETIRIMGVEFYNIKPPVDNDGLPIGSIVGYEILRGSREGNKTIFAKGMINNMREYVTIDNINQYGNQTNKTYLYPNYPYNPNTSIPQNWQGVVPQHQNAVVDRFLTSRRSNYKGPGLFESADESVNVWNAFLEDEAPLGSEQVFFGQSTFNRDLYSNVRKDFVTFHSPETNFRNPYLSGKELKVYGELNGDMVGRFQYPKDHPRHKFITNMSFLVSAIVGVGYAMLSTEGEKQVRYSAPGVNYGGTYTQVGVSTGTTGLAGPSALPSSIMTAAQFANDTTNLVLDKAFKYSGLGLVMVAVGANPNTPRDLGMKFGGTVTGSIGGQGGSQQEVRTSTAWEATPPLLRFAQGIPSFLTYWGEGVDKMLKIIYAFTPYRQYALQQFSHGFYNKFSRPTSGNLRRSIDHQTYLNPELQDFATSLDNGYRINNLYRSRTVAMHLESALELPTNVVDDSQQLFSDVWDRQNNPNAWENDEFINAEFQRPISSHYVAYKQRLANQYGQIANIIQVPVSTDTHEAPLPGTPATTPILFNGDTYVGRYTEKNTMFFFYEWLKGQPDGATYDYKLREMIPHPRFWMDSDPFDVSEFMRSIGTIFEGAPEAPTSFDPFMLDPAYAELNNPASPNYDPNADIAVCECELIELGFSNGDTVPTVDANGNPATGVMACLLMNSPYDCDKDLEKICGFQADVEQLRIYKNFLEDCACYNDTGSDGCNEDSDEPNPAAYWAPTAPDGYRRDFTNITVSNGFSQSDIDEMNASTCDPNYGSFPYDGQTGSDCSTCPTWNGASKYFDDDGPRGKWKRKINRIDRKIERAQKKLDKTTNKCYDKYLDGLDGDQEGWFQGLFDGIVTPSDKFAFDMEYPGKFRFRVKSAYMYLFNSGVRDFFVESEVNLDQRDWGESIPQRHYDHIEFTSLRDIFDTDHIKVGNYYKYDYSLSISKLYTNFISWSSVQERTYDPEVAETCFVYRPKRMIYSLPQQTENKKDNWRVFLPLNYKDFSSVTTSVKPVGKNGAMIFFENESPVQFAGVDQLQTTGDTKIIIGDGGLFSQPLHNMVNAEYPHEYGSCQNRLAISNTPAGIFYMSQNQGKIFQVGNGLQEISNKNLKWWFAKYLPYQLTKHPTAFLDPVTGEQREFELSDNPVIGIGCQTIYDNENQMMFFCKKDWAIRDDIADEVVYLAEDKFLVNGALTVQLGDPAYFRPASWTVSYDPKNQNFISYHDWHPDLVIPSKKTYMTTKDNGLWIHADDCQSYCNFYGVDYPFEVEFSLHTVTQVNTLRNVAYFMEVYVYSDEDCYDRFHVLDENFDQAIIYNSEQCSGQLNLNLSPKNDALSIVNYPQINPTSIDILYNKEEHKYRFNQFWDITDDRGEFSNVQRPIFNMQPNGYIKDLNPANLNYDKNELERKKFRHYKHTVLLRKVRSGDKNMIIAIAAQMNLNSPR